MTRDLWVDALLGVGITIATIVLWYRILGRG